MFETSIQKIASILEGNIENKFMDATINYVSAIKNACEGDITFLHNDLYKQYIYSTKASAIILQDNFFVADKIKPIIIRVKDVYTSLGKLLVYFQQKKIVQKTGQENPVYIGKNCTLGKNIYLGAFSYLGNNVTISDGAKIYPHAYVGDNVIVGKNTVLYSNVTVYPYTIIGKDCIIHAGAVLGSDGFGFAPQADGNYIKIPQIGRVVLEDNVEIGVNTAIDRATLAKECTMIQKGVKIDNLVHIGHNVMIKKNTVIAAQSGVSGSATIGKNSVLGGQVGIAGHITLGPNTKIGGQSGITKSFPKGNLTLFGCPGFEKKHFLKSYVHFKNLSTSNNTK